MQPGFVFEKEYLVAPVKDAAQAIEEGTLKVIRAKPAKRVELLEGEFIFPMLPDQIKLAESTHVLDDQNIHSASRDEDAELQGVRELFAEHFGPAGIDDVGEDERPPEGEAEHCRSPRSPHNNNAKKEIERWEKKVARAEAARESRT